MKSKSPEKFQLSLEESQDVSDKSERELHESSKSKRILRYNNLKKYSSSLNTLQAICNSFYKSWIHIEEPQLALCKSREILKQRW